MSNLITKIEQDQMKDKVIPSFRSGDTVNVKVKVTEGNRTRLQAYEGVVIGIRNRGLGSSFRVRKISYGEGIERTFQTYSDIIDSVSVVRRGVVRRANLNYLRGLSAKNARIKEYVGNKYSKKNDADKKS